MKHFTILIILAAFLTVSASAQDNWTTKYHKDAWGESTGKRYATTKGQVLSFKNRRPDQPGVLVFGYQFVVDFDAKIALQLFNRPGDVPILINGAAKYNVVMKVKNRKNLRTQAIYKWDRMVFAAGHSVLIHEAFLAGGSVEFNIYRDGNKYENYSFRMRPVKGYARAYENITP